eukprot:tig00020904_g15172.t1
MAREPAAKRARTACGASSAPGAAPGAAPEKRARTAGGSKSAAAGRPALESLPDDVLVRIFKMSARSALSAKFRTDLDGELQLDVMIKPRLLARLARVSRRFRQLAKDPGVWERVILDYPSDSTAEGLAELPAKTRAGIRSIALRGSKLADDGFHSLFRAVGSQLQELYVSFNQDVGFPFSALPLLQHFSRLRTLELFAKDEQLRGSAHKFGSPVVQTSLALAGSLSLQKLNLMEFPVSTSALQAIAAGPSKGTLTSLKTGVLLGDGESPAAALAAVGSLTLLSTLHLEFFKPHFVISDICIAEDALKPLSALTRLRNLHTPNFVESLEFMRPLASLAELSVTTWSGGQACDFSPLLASEGSLQVLRLDVRGSVPNLDSSAVDIVPRLVRLEKLAFVCADAVLEQSELAHKSLAGLKLLRDVAFECAARSPRKTAFPVPLLKRLASDVPSLERLRIGDFSLPFPAALAALSSLRRLPQLGLSQAAASSLDAEARRFLRSALPLTEITYNGKPDDLNGSA